MIFSMRQNYVRTNAEVFVKRIVRCRSRRRPPLNQPAQVLSCWRVCSAQRLTQVNVQENSSTAEGRIEVTAYRNTHADVTTAQFGGTPCSSHWGGGVQLALSSIMKRLLDHMDTRFRTIEEVTQPCLSGGATVIPTRIALTTDPSGPCNRSRAIAAR